MKKLQLLLVLGTALFFTGISAFAFDKGGNGNGNGNGNDNGNGHGKDDHTISAMDMSAMGLVAASMTGAGIYLVRRRRTNGR